MGWQLLCYCCVIKRTLLGTNYGEFNGPQSPSPTNILSCLHIATAHLRNTNDAALFPQDKHRSAPTWSTRHDVGIIASLNAKNQDYRVGPKNWTTSVCKHMSVNLWALHLCCTFAYCKALQHCLHSPAKLSATWPSFQWPSSCESTATTCASVHCFTRVSYCEEERRQECETFIIE